MLVDKLIKRKIDLVDLLNDSNGLVIQEIQEKLNLTGKTIRTELKDLLLDCPYTKEEIAIEKIGSKYVLQTKETINIETIKTNFKKSSLLFQIYYAIFCEKFLITKDSSNVYYCSHSKLHAQLKLVKKSVGKIGIRIDKNEQSYYLSGSEMLIRFQAYHYFWRISKGVEGLISQESRKKLIEVLNEIENELRLNFTPMDRERLMSWLWINKTRVNLGNYVENKKYHQESSTESLNNEKIKKKLTLFLTDSTEIELEHEVSFLVFILKMTLEKNRYNHGPEKETDVFYLGRKFVSEFRRKFDVKKECISSSFISGEALFYHQNLDIKLLTIQVEKKGQSELFTRDFDLFFLKFSIENGLKENNSEKLYDYLYALCFEQVKMNSYKPLLKVMVSCSEGEFSEYKIKQELAQLTYHLTFEEKNPKMTDLIITDYVDKENEDKIFYCTSTFTPRMITTLEKKLGTLEERKLVRLRSLD